MFMTTVHLRLYSPDSAAPVEMSRSAELRFPPYVGLTLQFSFAHSGVQEASATDYLATGIVSLESVIYLVDEGIFVAEASETLEAQSELNEAVRQWVRRYGFSDRTNDL